MRRRFARGAFAGAVALLLAWPFVLGGEEKQGTVADFAKLPASANVAANCFDKPTITMDAAKLEKTNHYSAYSKWFTVKKQTNYTLGVVYRAKGPSLISAGIKWKVEGQPMGLVDQEDHYACWPEAREWTLRTITFTSDAEYATAQIILKAYGGMSVEFKDVKLVEGWYCSR